jgi:hypothetical protein
VFFPSQSSDVSVLVLSVGVPSGLRVSVRPVCLPDKSRDSDRAIVDKRATAVGWGINAVRNGHLIQISYCIQNVCLIL